MWTAIVYVWPRTPILQFRACLCVLLLAIMRLLNLAVPVLYRNMVNKLSDAAIAASSGDPSGWQPTFWNVRPPLPLADLLHLIRTTHSSDHITETEGQSAAGCCLPRPWGCVEKHICSHEGHARAQALARGPIISNIRTCVQVFYPVVFLYMLASFFQGGAGTGSSGMLNNARSYLWIPIGQNAFRCLPPPDARCLLSNEAPGICLRDLCQASIWQPRTYLQQ